MITNIPIDAGLITTTDQAREFEKRFNEIRPDYSISFGFNYYNAGFEVSSFTVDENGRTTMEVFEQYLNNQYAIRFRYHTRHPRLTKKEIDYLLQK